MLKIVTGENNKILRTVCSEIKQSEYNKYIKLGYEMIKYIKNKDNGGVGLAAPQIGINSRLIVVSLLKDRDDENFSTIMMINPVILEHSEDMLSESEGCLSLPGIKGVVKRYKTIKISYINDKKNKKVVILTGAPARIVQHEIDHIDGILFIDKIDK